MADIPANLLDAALRLSDDAREAFADRLYESLGAFDQSDVESAWSEEIQRRIDQLKSGQERPMPLDQAWKVILEDSDASDAD